MIELVLSEHIERIVGVERHETAHYGRAVFAEQVFYILHSRQCFTSTNDLRTCEFSIALDRGIDLGIWGPLQDQAVLLTVRRGHLLPTEVTR